MRSKGRLVLAGLLVALLAASLFGCMGNWFTQTQKASLIFGNPVASGGTTTILVSVTNMPSGGLASLAVQADGLTLPKTKVADVKAAGLNGFTVLAQSYDPSTGNVLFVISNANAGSTGGTVAKITFTGSITAGDVATGASHMQLGSAQNTLIKNWQIVGGTNGKAYYAK
jgi:hypothetical protein